LFQIALSSDAAEVTDVTDVAPPSDRPAADIWPDEGRSADGGCGALAIPVQNEESDGVGDELFVPTSLTRSIPCAPRVVRWQRRTSRQHAGGR
jgi:hypothetical protein